MQRNRDLNGPESPDSRDVVARLGNGHLGGEVIAHDFGSEDGLSAHKLDTSFLADDNQNVLLVSDGTVVEQAYLDVSDGQSLAAGVANRFNFGALESVTTAEATVGVLAAAEAMFLVAPTDELNQLGKAFLPDYEHISDWGDVRNLLLDPLTLLPNPHRVSDNIRRAVVLNDAVLDVTRDLMDTGKVVATEAIEQTADGLKEIARAARRTFDYVDEVVDETTDALRDTTSKAYERAVEKTSEGMGRLVDIYESAEDFTLDQIDKAERFYDDTQQWAGEQIRDAADVIGRAHDTAVQNTSELIEQIDGTYESLKEESLDSVKEFVKDRLRDVTGLLRHAQDGLNELAPTPGDFIRQASDAFSSSLPLPYFPVSPLVLDLDSDGYELSALQDSNVRFDLDADGFAEHTGWVQPDDALLVLDRNANGKIDNGAELFGDHTPTADQPGTAPDGFSALTILDSNQDAILDHQDESFDALRLWRDINQDGRSSPQELTSLAEANIASLRLEPTSATETIAGHRVLLESTFTDTQGGEHAIGDILFEVDPVNAEFTGDYQLSMEALMLPLIRGYGHVPHLHIAMSQDPALLSRTQTLIAQGFSGSSNLLTEVEQLIIHWTGSENIDPDSRGPFVDAQKLAVVEAFMAAPFATSQGITEPGGNHAELLNLAWENLRTGVLQRLVAQDLRGAPFAAIGYEFATDTLSVGGSLSDLVESANTQQPDDSSNAIAYWHNIADFLCLSAPTLGVTEQAIEASLQSVLSDTELKHFSSVLLQTHLGGTTSQDSLHSGNDYNLLTAGDGDDLLVSSGTGYRALFGGTGDDELRSGALVGPATQFVGGSGQDTLIGSRYADSYHFNLGDGQDLIDETAGGFSSHQDRLYFGPGITIEDVSVTRDDLDLIFGVGTGGDSIRVKEWYNRPGSNGADRRIESVVFEDNVWLVDDIHNDGLEVHGTHGDDTLSAISYLDGNILHGEDGNDTLRAGTGSNDILFGGDGDDLLLGGDVSSDYLYGGAGDDELRSFMMNGPATHLSGGTGDDTLVGSRRADTYYFNLGDGQDLIDETAGGFSSHQDRLYFGPGITSEDVSVTRDDLDLIFGVGTGGDSIRVKEWYNRPGSNGADRRIESVVFEDNVWLVDDIHNDGLEVHGTHGDDTLSAISYLDGNILHGEDGNDTLRAGTGSNDILFGGDGDDLLLGGDVSSDYLYGGAGDDELRSFMMNGPATHLSGGTGDDTLVGSRRADTYYFNLGDGQDLIDETAGGFSSHQDRLYFGPGITIEDVSVTRDDLDLIFGVGTGGDSIRVKEWYNRPGSNGADRRIESVVFEDNVWLVDDIHNDGLEVHGTHGDDTLSAISYLDGNILHGEDGNDTLRAGTGSNDILFGGDGDDLLLGGDVSSDYLYGGAGDDELRSFMMNGPATHLSGGTGDDTLVGSRRADTYYFNLGDGQDLIDETAGGFSSHQDRLYFGPGITSEDVSVTRDDLDLIFGVGTGGDSIRVKEWYNRPGSNGADRRIETVLLADGMWDAEEIEDLAVENHSPTLSNPLADVETLALVPFEMRFNEAIFADVDQQEPLSLTVSLPNSAPLPHWLSFDSESRTLTGTPTLADIHSMEIVVTATDQSDATVSDDFELTVSLASGSIVSDTPLDDFLVGSPFDDVFVLGRGNDTLSGNEGDDTFVTLGTRLGVNLFDGGDGFDTVKGGVGNDIIQVDSFQPENSVELLDGGSGFDILKGTSAAQTINLSQTTLVSIEHIDAGGGADVVIGSSGDDVISGGKGNDILYGAEGDDQFLIRKRQGVDVFNGGQGIDSIVGDSTNDKIIVREFSAANSIEIIDGGEGFDMILGTGTHQTLDFSDTKLISIEKINGRRGNDIIIGSNERDIIFGGSGDDQLYGGLGDDELNGGKGNDTFSFARGDGTNIIIDNKGANDQLTLSGADHDSLWLWREGDDLAMGIVNTTDKVVIRQWFSSSGPTIETTQTSDDSMVLINSQVLQLVGAMSVFDPVAQGHLNLSGSVLEEAAPAIADAWQPA